MQHNKQKQRKGPRRFTPEEIERMNALREEHRQKKETDLEYREMWERRDAAFNRIALLNDSIETKT